MTDIRPQDLPELRAGLVESRQTGSPSRLPVYQACGLTENDVDQARAEALSVADLFYVAPAMGELASIARLTLPPTPLASQDMPSTCGLLFFDQPPETLTFGGVDGATVIAGALWNVVVGAKGQSYALLFGIVDLHASTRRRGGEPRPGLARFAYRRTAIPVAMGNEEPPLPYANSHTSGVVEIVRTAWLLMQQPLAALSVTEPDRAAKKRLRRAGQEPKSVRVIELRRPKSSGEQGDGESNYHHQWIVRGHWRNHWHPKREVHRPVWIAPHVKGPEGAPMIGGEKVYAWKR